MEQKEKQDSFIPTNDYVFKRIFGCKGNEIITKGLLNAILDEEVKEIDLDKNPITEKDLYDDKIGILDVKAVLNNEISCDIEMQVATQENIEERILFYWSKMYIKNIHEGNEYGNLRKCIAILIADFELDRFKNIQKSHTKWKLREEEFSKSILTDVCEIHIISLTKLKELISKNKLPEKEEKLKIWGRFLVSPKELGESDMENDEALKKAKEEYDAISQDEHEQYLAELRMKHIMDSKAIEKYGYRKGKEDGEKSGAKKEKIEIAKEMLKNGADIDFISKCTKLSKEEILKLNA